MKRWKEEDENCKVAASQKKVEIERVCFKHIGPFHLGVSRRRHRPRANEVRGIRKEKVESGFV